MRLHNRMVKAAFWTDTDLIRRFTRDERMFYQGLWQLADDSGCLENNPWAFKLHLFPLDDDLTPSVLDGWASALLEAGKISAYRSGNKDCYFLTNFHRHQPIRTPQPPSVPLPDWVKWQPYQSNPRTGRYIVESPRVLTLDLQVTDDALTDDLQGADDALTISDNVLLTRNQEPGTRNQEPGTRNQELVSVSAPEGDGGKPPLATANSPPNELKDLGSYSHAELYYLQANGMKRLHKRAQREIIVRVEAQYGLEIFRRAVDWAAVKGKSDLHAIETCAKKMATGPPVLVGNGGTDVGSRADRQSDRTNIGPPAKPGKYARI